MVFFFSAISSPRNSVINLRKNSESTIDSEGFKGGTRGAPIMPRDAVSRTANVERTGRGKINVININAYNSNVNNVYNSNI